MTKYIIKRPSWPPYLVVMPNGSVGWVLDIKDATRYEHMTTALLTAEVNATPDTQIIPVADHTGH